jgi:carboxylesterase type B
MAQAHAQISGGRAHVYSFGYRSTALNGRLGATHTVELPFVFDIADKPWLHGDTGLLGPDPAPDGLAAQVHTAWVAFAGTGDPGCAAYHPQQPDTSHRLPVSGDPVVGCRSSAASFHSASVRCLSYLLEDDSVR